MFFAAQSRSIEYLPRLKSFVLFLRSAGREVEGRWLLRRVGMLGTLVDLEIAHQLALQRSAGEHALDGKLETLDEPRIRELFDRIANFRSET